MRLLSVLGVHLMQWGLAYLALDLSFRTIPLEPAALRGRLRAYQVRFAGLAGLSALLGAAAQIWLAGVWGGALGLLGWLPWWILWRFGWRKQFPFLFKDDGGRHLAGATKPDPH